MSRSVNSRRGIPRNARGDEEWIVDANARRFARQAPTVAEALAEALAEEAEDRRWYESLIAEMLP